MKKVKLLLGLLLILIVTGCTIDMGHNKKNDEVNKDTTGEDNTSTVEKVESKGIQSSIDSPLSSEQIGIASKYNAVLDTYQDVDVKIIKVFDNASELVDEYNLAHQDEQIEAKKGHKFVALEYEVTLVNFETESFGTDVSLDIEILDEEGNSFVVDGVKQIVSINRIKESFGVTNNESGSVVIVFQIPDASTSYLMKLGTINHTIAYYKMGIEV